MKPTSKQKANKQLRYLSGPLDSADELIASLNDAAAASPRAAAIVASALIEDTLRWCLCGFLIPKDTQIAELPNDDHAAVFDGESAPLGTFHAKIIMGYALGIYGKITRENLKRIKNIRNICAHSPRTITFETPTITNECRGLRYDFFSRSDGSYPMTGGENTDPREHFLHVTRMLILHLYAIGFPDSRYAQDMGEMI
jgi:hypothetical protein